MVGMDSTFVGLMLHPAAKPCLDPATGKLTTQIAERVEKLMEELDTAREKIIFPTPALTEFLVLVGKDAPQYLNDLALMRSILIKPFDQLAAIELAAMELLARGKGKKRFPAGDTVPWQKVKIDRQIVATCKVYGVHTIYSDDKDVYTFADDAGIKVVRCWELPLPASKTPLFDGVPDPQPEPVSELKPTRRIIALEDDDEKK
jgi:hypothetical protein